MEEPLPLGEAIVEATVWADRVAGRLSIACSGDGQWSVSIMAANRVLARECDEHLEAALIWVCADAQALAEEGA